MIYLKEILDEIESNPSLLDEIRPDYEGLEKVAQYVRKFQTKNGLIYHIEAVESITKDGKKIADFKFKLMNNPKTPKRKDFDSEEQYHVALQKSQVGITGTGNVGEVIRKVIGAIDVMVSEINPDYISVTAYEENRQSLYHKLIDLMIKISKNTYRNLDVNPITHQPVGAEEFWLEKI
jgi:hypothetical protein